MKAALIIVDVQNDFLENGALPVKGANDIISPINKVRNEYANRFTTVFTTQQHRQETHIAFNDSPYAHEENLPFDEITLAVKGKFPKYCVQGTNGANFAPEMQLKGDEVLIRKDEDKFKEEMSAFQNGIVGDVLKTNNINLVFVVGLTLDFCVGLTAIDSAKRGFETYVIQECTKPLGDQSGEAMKKNFDRRARVLINKVIPNDTLELHLEPEDTKKYNFGDYVYDIQITFANGDVYTFIKGVIRLEEEVQ